MDSGDPDRPVTDGDLLNAIILTLYSTDNWPLLSGAISALRSGDGSQVKFLADYALERDEDGHYEPGDGAQVAINCLDHPSDEEIDYDEVTAEAAELEDISPLFGPALGYGEVACAKFPIKTDFGPRAIEAPEAPTMVVIGTTGAQLPVRMVEAMVDQLWTRCCSPGTAKATPPTAMAPAPTRPWTSNSSTVSCLRTVCAAEGG